jgi:hypothetical protein
LAATLGDGDPTASASDHPRLAAAVRDALRHDTHVEERVLADVLRRVSDLPSPAAMRAEAQARRRHVS